LIEIFARVFGICARNQCFFDKIVVVSNNSHRIFSLSSALCIRNNEMFSQKQCCNHEEKFRLTIKDASVLAEFDYVR
jgi:hypothetical protein